MKIWLCLFWGVVASMYMGNIMLVILNLPLIGVWVQILKIPQSLLYVFIILFCQIGAYSVNNNVTDVLIMNIFGLVGYLMKRYEFEAAPSILTLVLGRMFQNSLRGSLLLGEGSLAIFFTRPISAVFLIIALVLLFPALFTGNELARK